MPLTAAIVSAVRVATDRTRGNSRIPVLHVCPREWRRLRRQTSVSSAARTPTCSRLRAASRASSSHCIQGRVVVHSGECFAYIEGLAVAVEVAMIIRGELRIATKFSRRANHSRGAHGPALRLCVVSPAQRTVRRGAGESILKMICTRLDVGVFHCLQTLLQFAPRSRRSSESCPPPPIHPARRTPLACNKHR